MKLRFIALLLIATATTCTAQIKPEISETVELMGILSRTSGFREYCMDMGGQYTKDTEEWFATYKEHPAVGYYQELRAKYGISHDAVMTMAINIAADDGTIKLLTDRAALGERWKNVDVDTFIALLNQFYTDTKFHDFFMRHQTFYEEGCRLYDVNVMPYFKQDWYAKFYGTEPTDKFRVIIGFTNGGGNYGPNRKLPGQPKEVFAIAGYYINPDTGKAFENGPDYASTLIHEFNHSFVNPLLETESNATLMERTGKGLMKLTSYSMSRQSYNSWQTILNESIVRAAVIIYMMENGFTKQQIQQEMLDQIVRDFRWMPELVNVLRSYTSHRSLYPTLNDFYPEIARCLNDYLKKEQERILKSIQ